MLCDHRRMSVDPILAVQGGSPEDFGDEVGHDSKVLWRHLRKYGRENGVSRNSLIEPHEKGFEPLDAACPLVECGNCLCFHQPSIVDVRLCGATRRYIDTGAHARLAT